MFLFIALCFVGVVSGRHPAAPQHSPDHLPDTAFSCRDKVLGGYYADPDAQCQMFHVCVKVAGVGIQDFRFLCPNGTAFDQEAQICASWSDVACEPTALYYSSDNFDLYRIGSGFESKKAPVTFEDEQDFHLQRAEPDILSGAHSSNFFNNREGKDNELPEVPKKTIQYDQPPKKKIIRKLQRRPTESSPRPPSTPSRQFTNNFAGSYVPTTSRTTTTVPTTVRAANHRYDDYSNYNQRNNYQSTRQPSTAAPNDYYKSTINNQNYQKSEQTTAQNNHNRNFKSRQPTSDYTRNSENDQTKNKPTTTNYNAKQSYSENYNNEQYNQYSTPKYNFNKERKPKQNVQPSTVKANYNSESSGQYDNYQSSPQYNQNYNQPTTQKYNYNGEADKKNNNQDLTNYNTKTTQQTSSQYNQQYNTNNQQPTTYNSKTTQQASSQYNQQYNNNQQPTTYNGKTTQQASSQYNQQSTGQYSQNYDDNQYDKYKSTTKYSEKKQYNKQSTQYNYNDNQQYNNQQSSTPNYSTNLQYDNKQSTPAYNTNYNSQQRIGQSSTVQQEQQYSTASPAYNNRGSNYNQQYQQKSTNDYQQYSTNQQASSNQQTYDQKPTTAFQQYTTARSINNNVNYEQKSTASPYKQDDYDDGQYHPEIYEREAGGEYDASARKNARNDPPSQKYYEPELLKAAHSINIAASGGNQIVRDNRPAVQSSTYEPVPKSTRPTTQAPKIINTSTTAKSVYSSISLLTSAAPRPFSARPTQTTTIAPPPKPVQIKHSVPDKQSSQSSVTKSASSSNHKDVSYDYAYYDNTDHYGEYDNIEEFRRTSKKQ